MWTTNDFLPITILGHAVFVLPSNLAGKKIYDWIFDPFFLTCSPPKYVYILYASCFPNGHVVQIKKTLLLGVNACLY